MLSFKILNKTTITTGLLTAAVAAVVYSHAKSAVSLHKSIEAIEEENFKKFNLDPSLSSEEVETIRTYLLFSMWYLKPCDRFGVCIQQVHCLKYNGLFSHRGVSQFGESLFRSSQVDAACRDLPEPTTNVSEVPKKKKKKAKPQAVPSWNSYASQHSKTSAKSGDNGNVHKNKIRSHIYSSIYPWTTKHELVDVLMDSQILNNDELLVLNKPYGLAQVNTSSRKTYGASPPPFTLTDVLPILREQVQSNQLAIVIAPEKWQSGVLVLAKTKKARNRVEYCKEIAPSKQVCLRQFWTLTRNRAYPSERPYRVAALHGEKLPSGLTVPVLGFTPTVNKVKQGMVVRFYASHTTLAESESTKAALVQVGVTRTKHNSARVWLTHHLAPLLGDHLFGTRVAYLLDTPVPVPHIRAVSQPPYSHELLKRLDLQQSTQDLIPLMMHLRTITLPAFYKGRTAENKVQTSKDLKHVKQHSNRDPETEDGHQLCADAPDTSLNFSSSGEVDENSLPSSEDHEDVKKNSSPELVLTAPLPEHFSWTMERLGIIMPSL